MKIFGEARSAPERQEQSISRAIRSDDLTPNRNPFLNQRGPLSSFASTPPLVKIFVQKYPPSANVLVTLRNVLFVHISCKILICKELTLVHSDLLEKTIQM